MRWPSYYFYLLIGFSISNLGNWIYLIALNVFVWHVTHSPAAIAGLYVIGPLIRIICNFFVGSIIDRSHKKSIVIWTDILRGIFVCLMPFADNVWFIYLLVALTNIASTFFGPSSTYLITTLVSDEHKQRFNALHSTFGSGAFMLGPAIAGGILAISTTSVAMWVNGLSFFLCALLLAFIPNKEMKVQAARRFITFAMIKEDIKVTFQYAKEIKSFSIFLIPYSIALMIAFALDSQEMTFLLDHLQISESLYGITVTVAGVGALIGGIAATYFANKLSVQTYIQVGFCFTLLSYLCFYASNLYIISLISFVTLGFFMAFSNSGYATLFQTVVAPEIIGRFSSVINLFQGVLQLVFTLVIGFLAEWFSLQLVTVIFASIAFLLSVYIWKYTLKH